MDMSVKNIKKGLRHLHKLVRGGSAGGGRSRYLRNFQLFQVLRNCPPNTL